MKTVARPDFRHDSLDVCEQKLFKLVEACRSDILVLERKKRIQNFDRELLSLLKLLELDLSIMDLDIM